ncbi:MAG: hypothetical protein D6782_05060, partial [Alphaproteobacteria bacterium]
MAEDRTGPSSSARAAQDDLDFAEAAGRGKALADQEDRAARLHAPLNQKAEADASLSNLHQGAPARPA